MTTVITQLRLWLIVLRLNADEEFLMVIIDGFLNPLLCQASQAYRFSRRELHAHENLAEGA